MTTAAWKKEHYKNDPVYREKEKARCRKKYRENREYRERDILRKRAQRKDPEFRERMKKRIAEIRASALKHFPVLVCTICGGQDKGAKAGISFHEIHGNKHTYHYETRWKYIAEHHKEFRPLCRSCHSKVHHMMRTSNMSWQEILNVLKKARALETLYKEALNYW